MKSLMKERSVSLSLILNVLCATLIVALLMCFSVFFVRGSIIRQVAITHAREMAKAELRGEDVSEFAHENYEYYIARTSDGDVVVAFVIREARVFYPDNVTVILESDSNAGSDVYYGESYFRNRRGN